MLSPTVSDLVRFISFLLKADRWPFLHNDESHGKYTNYRRAGDGVRRSGKLGSAPMASVMTVGLDVGALGHERQG